MFEINVEHSDKASKARACRIKTLHGEIETPIFMPVGTVASVKSLAPDDLNSCNAQIILGNTYHLHLRPGEDVVESFGGLAEFSSWKKPTLTDSGGYQVFSLSSKKDVTDEGVHFRSHISNAKLFISPEKSMDIQRKLGADIVMAFDECVSNPSEEEYVRKSIKRTYEWAKRCQKVELKDYQTLFGITQGSSYKKCREESIKSLVDLDFKGYSIGGLAVGESEEVLYDITNFSTERLPYNKPRYLMGVGTPVNIVNAIGLGVDMFDCVLPTRNARNGQLFTSEGKVNISRLEYQLSDNPIDKNCSCYTCQNFSRGYLRHLLKSKELLYNRLASIHNVFYYLALVKNARYAIIDNKFLDFKKNIIETYGGKNVF